MNLSDIKDRLLLYTDEDRVFEHEPMDMHTTFRCGGAADIYVVPDGLGQFMNVLDAVRSTGVPYMVMGNGSNLLFTDAGYRGVVIRIAEGFDRVRIERDHIFAEPGVSLSLLSRMAMKEGLSGLEFACGIPGSLGGAVFMNAGAYGCEMKDVVKSVSSINPMGMAEDRKACDCGFEYRRSIYQENGGIIIGVKLLLKPGLSGQIEEAMKAYTAKRNASQPVNVPSAGSFFKRPEGHFAGKLVEDAGLKGFRIGGAQVSPLHAGFVVNAGGATASDVIDLMNVVRETVAYKFGVFLEPEVKIVGEQQA